MMLWSNSISAAGDHRRAVVASKIDLY